MLIFVDSIPHQPSALEIHVPCFDATCPWFPSLFNKLFPEEPGTCKRVLFALSTEWIIHRLNQVSWNETEQCY